MTVASLFFARVYGAGAGRVLSAIIAGSAISNVLTVTIAASRINQELARDGILPWSRLLASTWPAGSPTAGLIVHAIPSIMVIRASRWTRLV